ncbi:hypothetical protein SKAU_G00241710 [Synaphobranchus kaupii]|uniref:AIG1-type G domain-containing protein n=1 Tax=Synaphobranchus kaupii TaxID=118154 RepID=A0A9Q1F7X2_SYNKA|nr:hypothetical protein SKAU_G00241710 [Synaphobranchus kaupii]
MVIPLRPLKKPERREVEERLELFYECIWRRSIVLFYGKARLGGKTVEKFIEEEPCLQQLIQKCGNRYHVLSTENRKELLETIDVMVTAHSCASFQMMEASEEIEEKKAVLEENAKQRLVMVQKKRATLREIMNETTHSFSDTKMVLLGRFCAGKRSTGNTILGKDEFDTMSTTLECEMKQGEVNGRKVTVVLTPGWHRDFSGQEDTQNIKYRIKQSESLCPSKPHTFLLVIHCNSSFTETDRRRVEEHLSVLGEEASERTLVLFTWGDRLGEKAIELHIERWNELRWLVDKCGNRYHVLDNKSTDRSQVGELLEKVDEMLAESKCSYSITMYQETKQKIRELKKINEEKDREVKQMKEELEQKCQEIRSLDDNREREISHLKDELRKIEEALSEIRDLSLLASGQGRQGQPDLPSREEGEKQTEGEQELQREEKKLRDRHRTELEELEREFGEDSATKTLEEALQKLINRLKGETGVPMRELEEELKRKLEKKAWVEREERRRREEKEIELKKRHRREMEALSKEARRDVQGYLKPGLAVLGAVIGGILGVLWGPVGVAGGTTIGAVLGAQLGEKV